MNPKLKKALVVVGLIALGAALASRIRALPVVGKYIPSL